MSTVTYREYEYKKSPNIKQVWCFIWKRALEKVEPDEKSRKDADGNFLPQYHEPLVDGDEKTKIIGTLGFEKGRQNTLGRRLGYKCAPHHGVYNGMTRGSKPQRDRAEQLLKIAGFKNETHAIFCWASAERPSPIRTRTIKKEGKF